MHRARDGSGCYRISGWEMPCVVLGRVGAQGARRAARPHQPDYNQTNRVREMVLGSEGESERYL